MPKRVIPLINNHIYHIYNRGMNGNTIFYTTKDYERYQKTLWYYQYQNTTLSFSRFNKLLVNKDKVIYQNNLVDSDNRLVNVIAYCLMPNHFHLLVKQTSDGGISKYIGDSQNSCTRYLNIKRNTQGQLYMSRFKNVLIENDEQLKHVLRYIILNPYSARLIETSVDVFRYPFSSSQEYYSPTHDMRITYPNIIKRLFKNKSTYEKFITNNADYQRKLKRIQHLTLERSKPNV